MENVKEQIQIILFTQSDDLRFEDLYRQFYWFGLRATREDIANLINYLNEYEFHLLQHWGKFRILRDVIFYLLRSNQQIKDWVEHQLEQKRHFEKRKAEIFGLCQTRVHY